MVNDTTEDVSSGSVNVIGLLKVAFVNWADPIRVRTNTLDAVTLTTCPRQIPLAPWS